MVLGTEPNTEHPGPRNLRQESSGTVLLDVAGDGRYTHTLRVNLRKAGFRVVSLRKTKWDKKGDEILDRKKAKNFKSDFVIRGKVTVRHDRTAKFFEHVISYVYAGSVDVAVGKKKIQFKDDTGGDTHEEGRTSFLDMVARFTAADVLRLPSVKKRIPKKVWKSLKSFFQKVDEER